MKKVIIAVIMLLSVNAINAQEVVRNGDTFKMKSTQEVVDSITKFKWELNDGTKVPVYKTKTSFYIWRKSKKTGKYYRQYLPKEAQEVMRKEYNMVKKSSN